MFTLDNTAGYTQDQLDAMNTELELALEKYTDEELQDGQIEKHESEKIFNKYC